MRAGSELPRYENTTESKQISSPFLFLMLFAIAPLMSVLCSTPPRYNPTKDIEQMTPMQYVREQRMERACKLLTETDDSLSEISAAVGFMRQGSFSEAFKERFGITPHQYRKINR